jgi:hypothetical protein
MVATAVTLPGLVMPVVGRADWVRSPSVAASARPPRALVGHNDLHAPQAGRVSTTAARGAAARRATCPQHDWGRVLRLASISILNSRRYDWGATCGRGNGPFRRLQGIGERRRLLAQRATPRPTRTQPAARTDSSFARAALGEPKSSRTQSRHCQQPTGILLPGSFCSAIPSSTDTTAQLTEQPTIATGTGRSAAPTGPVSSSRGYLATCSCSATTATRSASWP